MPRFREFESIYSADQERIARELRGDESDIDCLQREVNRLRNVVSRLVSRVCEIERRPPMFFVEGDQ